MAHLFLKKTSDGCSLYFSKIVLCKTVYLLDDKHFNDLKIDSQVVILIYAIYNIRLKNFKAN